MKTVIYATIALLCITSCSRVSMDTEVVRNNTKTIGANPKSDSLQLILKKYTSKGIPGAVIGIKDANGLWVGAEGYAKIEDQTPMSPALAQYGYSITKMVTAVSIMQLKEKGHIQLDKPIQNYLPKNLHELVPQTEKVTVRMLLNHTSGYNDVTQENGYRLKWMDEPLRVWKKEDYFNLIAKRIKVINTPGSLFSYSNINYFLLSIVIDYVTHKPHWVWYQDNVFNRAGMIHTFYKQSPNYPFFSNVPNTYWSRFGTLQIENNTRMQQAYMQNEIYGEDGLIATPDNYIRFFEALLNGQLVSVATLKEMKQWVQNPSSPEPDYGLGFGFWGFKNKANFGHNGGGIGGHARLIYFPDSQTVLFCAVNLSADFNGPTQQIIMQFMNEVCEYLATY